MSTTEVDTAIRLTENYELEVGSNEDRYSRYISVTFSAVKAGSVPEDRRRREVPQVEIVLALQRPRPYSYGDEKAWTPDYDVQYGSLDCSYFDTDDPEYALAAAELLKVAADFLAAEHRFHHEELERQAAARVQKLEEEIKAEEKRNSERNKLKEELQWYVGQQFKLKREGYKATVFGTIDRFTDTHVYTTSERGVKMDTRIEDIYFFAIKYEGEKRYTTIYERQPKRSA